MRAISLNKLLNKSIKIRVAQKKSPISDFRSLAKNGFFRVLEHLWFFFRFLKKFLEVAPEFFMFFLLFALLFDQISKIRRKKIWWHKKLIFLGYNTYVCMYPEKISFCRKMRPYGCYMAYFGENGFFYIWPAPKVKKISR